MLACTQVQPRTKEIDRKMLFIPAGEFEMGTSQEEADALAAEYGVHPTLFASEMLRRKVYVKSFLIDRYPVTNAEYNKFIAATGYRIPEHWVNDTYPEGQNDYPCPLLLPPHSTDLARHPAGGRTQRGGEVLLHQRWS